MHISKRTITADIVCLMLVVAAGIIHVVMYQAENWYVSEDNIIFLLYASASVTWIYQIRRRVISKCVRGYMTGLGVLMIIYMAVRTFRCVYIPEDIYGTAITR